MTVDVMEDTYISDDDLAKKKKSKKRKTVAVTDSVEEQLNLSDTPHRKSSQSNEGEPAAAVSCSEKRKHSKKKKKKKSSKKKKEEKLAREKEMLECLPKSTDETDEMELLDDSVVLGYLNDEKNRGRIEGAISRSKMLRARRLLITEEAVDEDDSDEEIVFKDISIVVDRELPKLHNFPSLKLNAEQLRWLEEEGVQIRRGKWSYEEESILRTNSEEFQKTYRMKNLQDLLGLISREKVACKAQICQFVKFLGQGLENRTLLSIYQQARRMLNPNNYKGGCDPMEAKAIKRLITSHGRKWEMIGREVGRTGESVRHTFEFLQRNRYAKGQWSDDEDMRLKNAIMALTGCQSLPDAEHHFLPWKRISQLVKTRSRQQCRLRWLETVSTNFNPHGNGLKKWSTEHKIQLINKLSENCYRSEQDVSWDEIAAELGVVHCVFLRKKWDTLRWKVPNHYIRPFGEVLHWLQTYHMPILMAKVAKSNAKEGE